MLVVVAVVRVPVIAGQTPWHEMEAAAVVTTGSGHLLRRGEQSAASSQACAIPRQIMERRSLLKTGSLCSVICSREDTPRIRLNGRTFLPRHDSPEATRKRLQAPGSETVNCDQCFFNPYLFRSRAKL